MTQTQPAPPPDRAIRAPAVNDRVTREFAIGTERTIDIEARTVEMSFASEAPVERCYGYEILRCSPENVRLDRLNQGGALLCNHDWDEQIGVVESARVDGDGKCRAMVRFSRAAEPEEYFQDVIDGIRRLVSVGYVIHAVEERTEANVTTYTVTDWEPYEISLVSVPADVSVGVGRSAHPQEVHTMTAPTESGTTETEPAAPNLIEINSQLKDAVKKALARAASIAGLGAKHGCPDVAARMIADGSSESDMLRHVVAMQDAKQGPPKPLGEVDMPKREREQYSILRAAHAYLTRDWSKAGLELEASRTIADKLGREARGFFVPTDIRMPLPAHQRAMMVGDDTAGGYLVQESDLGLFIDALRARSVLASLGVTMLEGLVGDVAIPRVNTSASFYWLTEDADGTDSGMALGAVTLRPRTVAGAVPITRKLLQQTARSVEMMVRRDMMDGIALAIDKAGIQGSGVSGEPLGFVNQSGVKTVSVSTDGTPTWDEVVQFESTIETENALAGNLAYLMTPAVKGKMKVTAKAANQAIFIMSDAGTVNGYTAVASTQCPTNGLYFANWPDMLMGFWGILDIKPDEATKAASGGLVLRMFQDADVAVRHPESFCKGT